MKQRQRTRPPQAGFTIVEIIVVVVIIATLATMIVPTLFERIGQSKQSVAKANLVEIEKAIEVFSFDYDRYPENLDELISRPSDVPEEKWVTPRIKTKELLDPWGRRFIYNIPGEHEGKYDLYSLGKDGQTGGEKENADVVNW